MQVPVPMPPIEEETELHCRGSDSSDTPFLETWSQQNDFNESAESGNANNHVYKLIENLSPEGWKNRMVSRSLKLFPLQFTSELIEFRFATIRLPLIQERLLILIVYQSLITGICIMFLGSIVGWTKKGMSQIFSDVSGISSVHFTILVLQGILICFAFSLSHGSLSLQSIHLIELTPAWIITGVSILINLNMLPTSSDIL